ncbi:cytochrome P450 family protein (plasmid) [Streptomyces sp. BI20]|uniref:cytochrome P450 family protein n=1 Tax=Streptomyces sp. BI20 TaxID=3403460 RepID=UPI003C76C879
MSGTPKALNQYLDPYPYFGRLRAAGRAVRIHTAFAGEAWVITRHEDVQRLCTDPRLSVDTRHAHPELRARLAEFAFQWTDGLPPHLGIVDPPDHTRLRGLVSREFTARRAADLAPYVDGLVGRLLDEAAARPAPCDLVEVLAEPLPSLVICRLLGMGESDARTLRPLLGALTELPTDPAATRRVTDARRALWEHIEGVLRVKRRRPDSGLLSALIAAEDADRLDDRELTSMAAMLFAAGAETTTHMIGSAVLLLLRHPEQRAVLLADPSLVPGAVEEFLRYDSPVTLGLIRYAAADLTLDGTTVPRGSLVFLGVALANHDERRHADPEVVDVTRRHNPHMAFGHGVHYCLGAPLARLELRSVIARLLARHPDARLACEARDIPWRRSALRGPAALPVHLTGER